MDRISQWIDLGPSFEFPFVAGARGKTEERRAPVAVNDHTQLHSQALRIPAMEFTFHQSDLSADKKFEEARVCQRRRQQATRCRKARKARRGGNRGAKGYNLCPRSKL